MRRFCQLVFLRHPLAAGYIAFSLVSSFVSLARLVGRLVAILLICPSGRLVVLVNSLGGSLPRLVKQSAFSRFARRLVSRLVVSGRVLRLVLISYRSLRLIAVGTASVHLSRLVAVCPRPHCLPVVESDLAMAAVGMNAPFSSARFLIRRGRWR